ncbi:peptidoglycan endopeptidase RipA [Mycobacterium sp. shizuoka-1]|nr:peptidoglycan endopeptidase RipA [Mycobacterium sp. shizuoka-1]
MAALLVEAAAPAAATHSGADNAHEIGALIAQVAEAEQELADLGGQIQRSQEDVNRAVAEVETRRQVAAQAANEVAASRRSLDEAGAAILLAQKRFDEFAARTYTNGPSGTLIEAANPQDLIAAVSTNHTLQVAFSQALADLQRARIQQANRQSTARGTQLSADAAAADEQRSLAAAARTLTDAQNAFGAQQERVNQIVAQRDSATSRLTQARTKPGGAASWDFGPVNRGWDTVVPAVPAATITGDPVAIINYVLQVSFTSAQVTADLGRKFLTQAGILPPAAASADSGITNGRIPYANGRQASEYVIRRAMSQIGVPYSWGGGTAAGPSRGIDSGAGTVGFDCSGLMLYAFAGVGIKLPHYSGSQYNAGRKIPVAQMRRGDLLFWGPAASQHEALYLGDGMMLEAQQTGVPVKISPVRTSGMAPYATRLIEY